MPKYVIQESNIEIDFTGPCDNISEIVDKITEAKCKAYDMYPSAKDFSLRLDTDERTDHKGYYLTFARLEASDECSKPVVITNQEELNKCQAELNKRLELERILAK